jgi:hypothetical protein
MLRSWLMLGSGVLCAPLLAQGSVYEQPMAPNGGITRASQLWVDPTGQNDSDNDAIAWEDFQLPTTTTVTRIRWWGQAAPPLGFQVSFFNQDPNTIAVQPDIFAPGSGPIDEQIYTSFLSTPVTGGMTRFEVSLATPLTFQANTRYFISIVGLTPLSFAEWRWASSTQGPNGTFWWSRGMHMYFHLGESRAVALAADPGWVVGTPFCFGDGSLGTCPCGNSGSATSGCSNSTGLGAEMMGYGEPSVGADTLLLTVRQCPSNVLGIFLSAPNYQAPLSFGAGLRCLGGPLRRLGAVSTIQGIASNPIALSTAEGLVGGELRHYQFWYRNPGGPCSQSSNVSNAVTIQW